MTPKLATNSQKDAFQIMMCASKSNDGSPELRSKRTSDQLSSPSSPANAIEVKKSKTGAVHKTPQK